MYVHTYIIYRVGRIDYKAAKAYYQQVQTAYKVVEVLKKNSELRRCVMIFERLEVDYAHIKPIPVLYMKRSMTLKPCRRQ